MMSAPQRLLIAEDDAGFRTTLELEFKERCYDVTGIASVEEFEALADQSFDLAVIDLKLGPDSGLALLELLLEVSPQAKVVVITGYGGVATAVKAIQLGAANYLAKPVGIDQLEVALAGTARPVDGESYRAPSLARHEWEYIEYVLERCNRNISQAAKELGIHRQSLQRKPRKYPPRQ